jgi:hypothetical protein
VWNGCHADDHKTPTSLKLDQWNRLYTVLDADAAGQAATARLLEAFGPRVVAVQLPPGVEDPADLVPLPDGNNLFYRAVALAAKSSIWPVSLANRSVV